MTRAAPTHETIRWLPVGPGGGGAEATSAFDSTRLYRIPLDTFMVGGLARGQVDWRYRGTEYTQQSGDVVLGEPGELYATSRHHVPGRWHALFVPAPLVESTARELGVRGAELHLRRAQAYDPSLLAAIARVYNAHAVPGSQLARDAHLARCLELVVDRYAEAGPPPSRAAGDPVAVRRAREYLHAHATSDVSLDVLARAAYASKYHLIRAFRRAVGVPPHAYQVYLRVAVAKRLIAQGVPISHAALDAGFAAQSHLHRHFVRAVGVTPGEYARAMRGPPERPAAEGTAAADNAQQR